MLDKLLAKLGATYAKGASAWILSRMRQSLYIDEASEPGTQALIMAEIEAALEEDGFCDFQYVRRDDFSVRVLATFYGGREEISTVRVGDGLTKFHAYLDLAVGYWGLE